MLIHTNSDVNSCEFTYGTSLSDMVHPSQTWHTPLRYGPPLSDMAYPSDISVYGTFNV